MTAPSVLLRRNQPTDGPPPRGRLKSKSRTPWLTKVVYLVYGWRFLSAAHDIANVPKDLVLFFVLKKALTVLDRSASGN
jgi:hypothetical protein